MSFLRSWQGCDRGPQSWDHTGFGTHYSSCVTAEVEVIAKPVSARYRNAEGFGLPSAQTATP
ncbi:MAG: hypothetical protein WCH39_09005 [Schlesneria sp.]